LSGLKLLDGFFEKNSISEAREGLFVYRFLLNRGNNLFVISNKEDAPARFFYIQKRFLSIGKERRIAL
jgi:hypothetical protein